MQEVGVSSLFYTNRNPSIHLIQPWAIQGDPSTNTLLIGDINVGLLSVHLPELTVTLLTPNTATIPG